jgi:hypothetical protein
MDTWQLGMNLWLAWLIGLSMDVVLGRMNLAAYFRLGFVLRAV